jgi:hypothetical protein
MDHERFDAIARTLASGVSRRGVLRTLSGVGAGGVLTAIGRENAAAIKCKRFLRCGSDQNKTCCTSQVTACDPQTDTCQSCTATFETCDPDTTFCCFNSLNCGPHSDCGCKKRDDCPAGPNTYCC